MSVRISRGTTAFQCSQPPSAFSHTKILLSTLCLAFVCSSASAQPAVSNVTASQRTDGSGLVDVYYDLSGGNGDVRVDVTFSNDNGQLWNVIPIPSLLSGDIGNNVSNGNNKHIIWDAGRDRAEVYWPQAKARVRASSLGDTVVFNLPGGVELEMVKIPAGSFSMGAGLDPPYSSPDEAPVHVVTIDYEFFMSKYEITQEQWYAMMAGFPFSQNYVGNTVPVHYVSWLDSHAFLSALNNLGIGTFRLASEAEWEYACRAGGDTRWHVGDDPEQLGDFAWYSENNEPSGLKVVGQKQANAFGLFDMHGNAWEWVQDLYNANYQGAPIDGSAWEESADTEDRVARGGSFKLDATSCRSAERRHFPASLRRSSAPGGYDGRDAYRGIRIVRDR